MGTSQMRSKSFVLLLLCIVATTILFCYFSDQRQIHNLVTETHKQLSNLGNLKKSVAEAETELTTDKQLLDSLGFTDQPRLYPNDSWQLNSSLPVVVTAASSGDVLSVKGFVKCIKVYLPTHHTIVYDIGLSYADSIQISDFCNVTGCTYRKFDFERYPSHVQNLRLKAYRPIIIQEALDVTGAVFWLDINIRVISNVGFKRIFERAKNVGVAGWSSYSHRPTSALTHHRMFQFFDAEANNFFFHRMVGAMELVLYNTREVHINIMLKWIKCVLTFECIAPIGAQSSGCRYDKKPLYLYSGCHHYDVSALNIVLGVNFRYDFGQYLIDDKKKYFSSVESLQKSSTDTSTDPSFKKGTSTPVLTYERKTVL